MAGAPWRHGTEAAVVPELAAAVAALRRAGLGAVLADVCHEGGHGQRQGAAKKAAAVVQQAPGMRNEK